MEFNELDFTSSAEQTLKLILRKIIYLHKNQKVAGY